MLDLNVKLKCGSLIKLIITCLSWHIKSWIMSTNKENSQRKDVTKLENQVHRMSVFSYQMKHFLCRFIFRRGISLCIFKSSDCLNTALRNVKGIIIKKETENLGLDVSQFFSKGDFEIGRYHITHCKFTGFRFPYSAS